MMLTITWAFSELLSFCWWKFRNIWRITKIRHQDTKWRRWTCSTQGWHKPSICLKRGEAASVKHSEVRCNETRYACWPKLSTPGFTWDTSEGFYSPEMSCKNVIAKSRRQPKCSSAEFIDGDIFITWSATQQCKRINCMHYEWILLNTGSYTTEEFILFDSTYKKFKTDEANLWW